MNGVLVLIAVVLVLGVGGGSIVPIREARRKRARNEKIWLDDVLAYYGRIRSG